MSAVGLPLGAAAGRVPSAVRRFLEQECFVVLALASTLALFARRAGASPRSVALVALLPLCVAPWVLQLRTQTLALPLFVAVYGLLAADSRRPSLRVWLVFPLLVLWGNLHGSVVLGAMLVG